MRTTNKRNRETDTENRKRALAILQKVKDAEKKKKQVPLFIRDENNTVLMVSPKLTSKQREVLRERMLHRLTKRQSTVRNCEL